MGSSSFTEPRLALTITNRRRSPLTWGIRVATGLYHQFITQHDLSTANLGAVLPSLRIWIPVQTNQTPPRSMHVALNVHLEQPGNWLVQMETYLRNQPNTLALRQLPNENFFPTFPPVETGPDMFLEEASGRAYGMAATIEKTINTVRFATTAEWNQAWRRIPSYLENRRIQPPWLHPFQIQSTLGWQPASPWLVQAKWNAVWGRKWGFRQIYYDTLASDEELSQFPPVDLSDPEAHSLPPFTRLILV